MSSEAEAPLDSRDYLCYALLEELEAEQHDDRSITRTQFLKLACIADRQLSDEHGIDLKLPRYWYKYGEILNEQPINDGLYNETSGEWGGKKIQPALGTAGDSFDVDPSLRNSIREVTHNLAHNFATSGAEEIKRYQYKHYAPNAFIRLFDEFRDYLNHQEEENHSLDEFGMGVSSTSDQAIEFLDDLFIEYPTEQYSEMYSLFLRWEDTTRMLLTRNRFEDAKELAQNFWETFSKVELRVHHEQHTPRGQKTRWKNHREEAMQTFEDQLNNVRREALSGNPPSDVLETVVPSSPRDSA